jgi:hypothetical protein
MYLMEKVPALFSAGRGVRVIVSRTFFVARAGQRHGPITEDEFRKLIELGHLKADDLIWSEGAADWIPAASFLDRGTTSAAAPPGPSVAQRAQRASPKADEQTPARSWINARTVFWGLIIIVVIIGVVAAEPGSMPYRLAGAINGAIFGGIAGALGALLQYLIEKKLTVGPVSIAVVFGFIVGQAAESSINFVGGEFYDQKVRPALTQELFGQKMDSMPIYQALKRADPEAYSGLRSELAKRAANGASAKDIGKHAETYTASYRRKNAGAALAASPKALAALMQTLVDILDYLHARDESLCGEYVLQAFASERIRLLAREADFEALIQRQATTVFDAIAEGLRHTRTYEPLTDADIQLVIQGLQRRGWSDQMRGALADPGQLRMLPLGRVCRMQRELLATLASLPEPTRTRWFREFLEPILRS